MQTTISVSDLGKLARLSCAVVHGIDFPELGDSQQARKQLLGEVDRLDQRYQNDVLLFDLRAAVCSCPLQKQSVYSLTRGILRKLRGSQDYKIRPTSQSYPVIPPHTVKQGESGCRILYS